VSGEAFRRGKYVKFNFTRNNNTGGVIRIEFKKTKNGNRIIRTILKKNPNKPNNWNIFKSEEFNLNNNRIKNITNYKIPSRNSNWGTTVNMFIKSIKR
jgi:hypothetical protein